MLDRNVSTHEKGLQKVIVVGASLSFAILGAIIGSMKDFIGGNAAFEFSYRTVVGFVAGALVGWLLWRLVRFWIEHARKGGP